MSEDDSTHAPDGSDKPSEKRRSWLDRLSSAFSGEPSTRDDLVAILRDAHHGCTGPHHLARLVLTEQIYRALNITKGTGYHHD